MQVNLQSYGNKPLISLISRVLVLINVIILRKPGR